MKLCVLLDTDILIKCACFSMLDQIQPPGVADGDVGILGAAKFVVREHLARQGRIRNRPAAQGRFEDHLRAVTIIEPTEEELALASLIEDAGVQKGVDLDVGESQLCAIAILRLTPLIVTGDKRAILGAETLRAEIADLSKLRGRLVCLEQAVLGVANKIGFLNVRLMICEEPAVDKSLTICCECSSGMSRTEFTVDGLLSYVRHLRDQAPVLLYELDAM